MKKNQIFKIVGSRLIMTTASRLFAICLIFFLFSQLAFSESRNLSSELVSNYKSGFYPGVVRLAEEILRTEKNSLSRFRAAVYEAESLFKMGRIPESVALLEGNALNSDGSNPEGLYLNSAKYFWLGRGYFSSGSLPNAQNCFYYSGAIFKELEKSDPKFASSAFDYYSLSILFGAKCYIEQGEQKKSIPLFEYVVSNGKKFAFEDFSDSCLSLAQSYNFSAAKGDLEKCLSLVNQTENAKFDDETKFSLQILKGEALEKLGEYKKAYETYCYVLKNAPPSLAAVSMQKAYALSSLHREVVTPEVGEVLSQAEYRLAEYPDLLSEFWTRLAVDAFKAKDYEKSLLYFKEAKENASSSQKEIASLYKAEIAYLTANDKSEGSKKALSILSESIVTKSGSKNENLLINFARFNGYLKNWKDCETYAERCLNSENPEIEKNAVYWLALSKYERGDCKNAVVILENYEKKGKITDKSILNLYAKSLAKEGKYHEADQIFYSLGQKGELDNDGRLDYSRTLLIAGHYVSTKEQASKASGDEAVYLSSLAAFNQRKWAEAEKGFLKIRNSKALPKDYVAYTKFYLGYSEYQLGKYSDCVENLSQFVKENPLHAFVYSSYMTGARSSAFLKNTSGAIAFAENAEKTAKNESEKNEALILRSALLSDSKRYDEALALLKPYLSKKSEFGYECKYRSAEILVQKGEKQAADKYFSELSSLTDKNAALISEESCYRRAEIAYSDGDFAKSAELFEEYSKKWPSGRFKIASVYFSADSLAKTGDDTRAILRFEQITDSKLETSYRYGSEKSLVSLYEKTKDYESALKMAQKMIDEYGKQAVNDGIDKKIADLKAMASKNTVTVEEKIKTAESSLSRDKNNEAKSGENMKNALFLAGEYRKKGENKKSAEMYLEAAKYSRLSGNDENAARSFYGAVESFDAARLYADAKATFGTMKQLYPENQYTKNAEKLLGN